jgi:hypothetical protein
LFWWRKNKEEEVAPETVVAEPTAEEVAQALFWWNKKKEEVAPETVVAEPTAEEVA